MPTCTSKKHFSTCIVVNSEKYFVQSNNWKQDWWSCNNVSYADVVKSKGNVVNNVKVLNVGHQKVKSVENHMNTNTKRDHDIGKNTSLYCCKYITPKQGQNTSKLSMANKNISIAHGKVTSDTKSHYSGFKVIEKLQITMANYPDINNGHKCESKKNSYGLDNGITQRCDFSDNGQGRTSNQVEKTKGSGQLHNKC